MRFSEYQGLIKFKDMVFEAEYRTAGDCSCGGYKLCLKIYNGYQEDDLKKEHITAHSYFGDDKYCVDSVKNLSQNNDKEIKIGDFIEIKMMYPLYERDNIFGEKQEKILMYITSRN